MTKIKLRIFKVKAPYYTNSLPFVLSDTSFISKFYKGFYRRNLLACKVTLIFISDQPKFYLKNFPLSFPLEFFVGQLKSTLTCTECRYRSLTFDPFWDLSLPIPSVSTIY